MTRQAVHDLGGGVSAEWWTFVNDADVYGPGIVGGIVEHHQCKTADGEPYDGMGSVPIDPRVLIGSPHWTIEAGEVGSFEGLTLTPSILCRNCGNHGWIRDGRWVPA